MLPSSRWSRLRLAAIPAVVALLAAGSRAAQMAPTRTWEELKQETQRRVDKNLGPVGGLKSFTASTGTNGRGRGAPSATATTSARRARKPRI